MKYIDEVALIFLAMPWSADEELELLKLGLVRKLAPCSPHTTIISRPEEFGRIKFRPERGPWDEDMVEFVEDNGLGNEGATRAAAEIDTLN